MRHRSSSRRIVPGRVLTVHLIRAAVLDPVGHMARARDQDCPDTAAVVRFREVPSGARANAEAWRSQLEADLARLERRVATGALDRAAPWDRLCRWAEPNLSLEGQEQLVSLMLAPYGALVDDLADTMAADESAALRIDGAMSLDRLREIVGSVHGWALKLDWSAPDSSARVWYVSAEKLEPRLGERHEEPIEAYERPLAPGRDGAAMQRDLDAWEGEPSVAAYLLAHPEHRYVARGSRSRRTFLPHAEVRDNTIPAAFAKSRGSARGVWVRWPLRSTEDRYPVAVGGR